MNDRRVLDRILLFLGVSTCCSPLAIASGHDMLVITLVTRPGSSVSNASEDPFEGAFRRRLLGAEEWETAALEPDSRTSAAIEAQPAPTDAFASPLADSLAKDMLSADPAYDPNAAAFRANDDSKETYETPQHPALSDKFFFGFGAFYASSTTEARLDSDTGLGTTVGFEDLLGLDNSKIVPQGLARWRMSDRWRLELEYFSLNRENSKALGQDVNWGDQNFLTGTVLDSKFDVSVYRLSAGYSFFKTPDKEFGVALGFHITDVDVSLSSGGANEDSGKLLAPLPVLSFYGLVALTDQVAISGRLDAFRLEYDPYKGHIYSLGVDMLYQPWRHVGMGLGWRSLEMEFSASNSDWEGSVRSIFQGPIAFISVSF